MSELASVWRSRRSALPELSPGQIYIDNESHFQYRSGMAQVGAGCDAQPASGLPPTLTTRRFGTASALAVTAHLLLVAALLVLSRSRQTLEEAPVRLVFLEPAPPPAAPLGEPDGSPAGAAGGERNALPLPKTLPEHPAIPEGAIEPDRLRHLDPKQTVRARKESPKPVPSVLAAKLVPRKRPSPQARAAPPGSGELLPARGSRAGAVEGRAGGEAGGVANGVVGGVVGARGDAAVPVGQVARAPVLLERVDPVYPQLARRRRIEGLVLLEAILDRSGRIEPGVRVVRSVPSLDAAALAAVQRWRFRPARDRDGTAVRVILEIPIRFVLN